MHASLTASIITYRKELRDQMSSKEKYEQEKVNLDCCPAMIQSCKPHASVNQWSLVHDKTQSDPFFDSSFHKRPNSWTKQWGKNILLRPTENH